jgi:hypothetical protein
MGGEGSMASAILSLKQNRALLKKRKIKDIKQLLYENSGKTQLEFKQVTSEELEVIKTKIREDAKSRIKKEIIVSLVLTIVILALIIYTFDWLVNL